MKKKCLYNKIKIKPYKKLKKKKKKKRLARKQWHIQEQNQKLK